MKQLNDHLSIRNMSTICFLRAKLYTNLNIVETVYFTKSTKTDAHKYQLIHKLFLILLHFKECFIHLLFQYAKVVLNCFLHFHFGQLGQAHLYLLMYKTVKWQKNGSVFHFINKQDYTIQILNIINYDWLTLFKHCRVFSLRN